MSEFIKMTGQSVYADFGFDDVIVKLSTRPAKRVGSDADWDKAEADLAAALTQNGLAFEYQPGRGRFLRPQDRIHAEGFAVGRMWQVGTIQLDYNLP